MAQFLLLVAYLLSVSTIISTDKVYRTDYEYNRYTDSFYKFHIESVRPSEAERICRMESATLMLPASQHDIAQFHGMFKKYPDMGNFAWVANDGQAHESAEEVPIIDLQPHSEESHVGMDVPAWRRECDVLTREGEVETTDCFRAYPFICKVEAKNAPYNKECKVYGTGYQRGQNVSSCYKVSTVPYTWNQAFAECNAEGSHLVVLNSQVEHDEVQVLMNTAPSVQDSQATWFFHAGFRAPVTNDTSKRVFKTIFGVTLEQAGYSTWADNEPNNALQNENCGTLFKNDGKLNDADCTSRFAFICENEITA